MRRRAGEGRSLLMLDVSVIVESEGKVGKCKGDAGGAGERKESRRPDKGRVEGAGGRSLGCVEGGRAVADSRCGSLERMLKIVFDAEREVDDAARE